MIRPSMSSQSQSSQNESSFNSSVQNLSRWIINQRNQKNSTQMDFAEVISEDSQIQDESSTESTTSIENIKEQLRDSSRAIISTQIKQYNAKSHQSEKNSSIQQCFQSISSRILSNYMNSLKILIVKEKLNAKTEEKQEFNKNLCELEDFMKHCFEFIEVKYRSYCGEDQDEMMVYPTMQVKSLVEKLQRNIVEIDLDQEKNEQNHSTSSSNNKASTLQETEKALKDQLTSFSVSVKNSIPQYEKFLNKIDPQISIKSKQDLNQLLRQNKILIDTFMTSTKPNFIVKLMFEMYTILKSKIGNNKFLPVLMKNEDRFGNALQQRDFNRNAQKKPFQKIIKGQKKQQVRQKSVQNKNEQLSLNEKELSNFSNFFQESYLGQYKEKNQSNQQLVSQQQILTTAYEYSQKIYQQTFTELLTLLNSYINLTRSRLQKCNTKSKQEQISTSQVFSTLVRRIMTSGEKSSLVQANIQCSNEKMINILSQFDQLIAKQQVEVWRMQNNLRKQNDHTLKIMFAFKKENTIPCQLTIRLDQRLSTSRMLRQNYQMLQSYLRQLTTSPFGAVGQMALYTLSINGSAQ